jgi:predicted ATPase
MHFAGAARAGQILVGGSTHHLTRRAFAFTPLTLEISGIAEPVAAYRVERLRRHTREARGIEGLWAELIGRDRELVRLQDALACVLQGQGQMVSLIGEAGAGKSRLVTELREIALAPGDDGAMPVWLEGRCLELGTPTGYAPLIDMLHEYLAWRPGEEVRRRRESIATCLRRMVKRGDLAQERAQEMGPVLGRLLSLSWDEEWDDRLEAEGPDQLRRRTFMAVYDFFLALSRQRPVVLVFEDLHWADTLSLDLISTLMEGLSQVPLLLLAVYRPEREHRCWHLATIAARKCGPCYTELNLRELTGPQSERMAESLLDSECLPVEVRDLVLGPSQGNPFFIEEVVHSLIDAGIVYRDGATWHVRPGGVPLAVPEGVQSLILSRVDRLDGHLKHVLQVASVIGRAFRRRVLEHVIQGELDLQSALWELEERALVYQERAVPEVEYSFRHVLTQEAVYENVTRRRRQVYHRQVAAAIEALYAENLEQYSEQLAYHYDWAGDVAKAVEYLVHAGEKARRSYANEEAIIHLNRGLELLQTLPATPQRDRQELDLLVSLGVPLVLTQGHAAPEVQRTYAWALELSERLGDVDQRFHALLGLRRFYLLRENLGAACEFGERLLDSAQHTGDPHQLARAHMMHAETTRLLGEFTQTQYHCEEGLACYDPQQRHSHVYLYGNDTGIGCRAGRAHALWYLGYPDAAAREAQELLAQAHELAHPFTLAFALHYTASVRQLLGEAQIVQQHEEATIRISREHGFPIYLSMARGLRGWALAVQGEVSAGIVEMQAGIAAREASGTVTLFSDQLSLLAEVYGRAGRTREALDQLDEALRLVAKSGERVWLAEMYRLQGELLLAAGEDAARAEACLERALDIARRQCARSWELRAATSLARLWQRQGKTQEAKALLQGIHGWFSEGFDTADLVQARALLDAL